MQVSNPQHHRPFHTAHTRIGQYFKIMLPVERLPRIEDVIAQTAQNLEKIVKRIKVFVLHSVVLHPKSFLFRLEILKVQFEQ
jgi:hypothetical protein